MEYIINHSKKRGMINYIFRYTFVCIIYLPTVVMVDQFPARSRAMREMEGNKRGDF